MFCIVVVFLFRSYPRRSDSHLTRSLWFLGYRFLCELVILVQESNRHQLVVIISICIALDLPFFGVEHRNFNIFLVQKFNVLFEITYHFTEIWIVDNFDPVGSADKESCDFSEALVDEERPLSESHSISPYFIQLVLLNENVLLLQAVAHQVNACHGENNFRKFIKLVENDSLCIVYSWLKYFAHGHHHV